MSSALIYPGLNYLVINSATSVAQSFWFGPESRAVQRHVLAERVAGCDSLSLVAVSVACRAISHPRCVVVATFATIAGAAGEVHGNHLHRPQFLLTCLGL